MRASQVHAAIFDDAATPAILRALEKRSIPCEARAASPGHTTVLLPPPPCSPRDPRLVSRACPPLGLHRPCGLASAGLPVHSSLRAQVGAQGRELLQACGAALELAAAGAWGHLARHLAVGW